MELPISTRELVVPLRALSTRIVGSASAVISWLTWRILSGLPTEVPPNFITFIWFMFIFSSFYFRPGVSLAYFGMAKIKGEALESVKNQPGYAAFLSFLSGEIVAGISWPV